MKNQRITFLNLKLPLFKVDSKLKLETGVIKIKDNELRGDLSFYYKK